MTGYQSKKAAAQDKLAQPAQEPVAYLCSPDKNGLFGLPTADKACKDCFPVYRQSPQPAPPQLLAHIKFLEDKLLTVIADGHYSPYTTPPQRPWVGLTDEDCKGMSAGDRVVAMWADRTLKEKNNAA